MCRTGTYPVDAPEEVKKGTCLGRVGRAKKMPRRDTEKSLLIHGETPKKTRDVAPR